MNLFLTTDAREAIRPPRLNFFPFKTRAGTIGTDGIGDDVVAEMKMFDRKFSLKIVFFLLVNV